MGVYTTFFLASDDDMRAALPGLVDATSPRHVTTMRDPFSGETVQVECWASRVGPDWAPGVADGATSRKEFLHLRLPAAVRRFAHMPAQFITPVELDVIASALGLGSVKTLGGFLSQDDERALAVVDPRLMDALAAMTPATCEAVAPTVAADQTFVLNEFTADHVHSLLRGLRSFAAMREQGQHAWLLMEA